MTSIFDRTKVFTTYRCTIEFRNKLLAGTPKHPKVIEGWIRSKFVDNDEEVRYMVMRTLQELGVEITPDMSYDDMVKASEAIASEKQTCGFKQNGQGLYIESRQIKAGIKETVNILWPWDNGKDKAKWRTKSARNYTSETVFVQEDDIPIGRDVSDGVEMLIKRTPNGSALGYHEYAVRPKFSFNVMMNNDTLLDYEKWAMIWTHMQENGLGACRSQGFGRFDVVEWEKTG